MATLSPTFSGVITTRNQVNSFVPNVWAMEILRYRDRMFHLAAATKTMSVVGKKGDTVHFPKVGRLRTSARTPGSPVNLQTHTPGQWRMTISQDREVSFGLDDLVAMQSQYDTRSEYTREASYAHVRYLDNFLLGLRATIPTANRIYRTTGTGAGTAAGDPAPIDEATLLAAMQNLLERDVPLHECRWIFSPNQLIDVQSEVKFSSKDYDLANLDIKRAASGIVGTLYGLPVHVTTQISNNTLDGLIEADGDVGAPTPGVAGSIYLPDQEDSTTTVTTLARGKTGAEVAQPFQTGMLVHPRWAMVLKQKDVTIEQSREVLYQTDLVVTRQVFGAKSFYPEEAVLIFSRGS